MAKQAIYVLHDVVDIAVSGVLHVVVLFVEGPDIASTTSHLAHSISPKNLGALQASRKGRN
jgi:hypothetical protein